MKRVVKYGAQWCGQCKQQDKEFDAHPLKCTLDKVDVDTLSDEDIEKLNIKSLPVTILFEDSIEVKRWKGFVKSEEINALL